METKKRGGLANNLLRRYGAVLLVVCLSLCSVIAFGIAQPHPASAVRAGTFGDGNYIFPAWLEINDTLFCQNIITDAVQFSDGSVAITAPPWKSGPQQIYLNDSDAYLASNYYTNYNSNYGYYLPSLPKAAVKAVTLKTKYVRFHDGTMQEGATDLTTLDSSDTPRTKQGVIRIFSSQGNVAVNSSRIGNPYQPAHMGSWQPLPSYSFNIKGNLKIREGGLIFPDGTIQTTAAGGGGAVDAHSLNAVDGDPVDALFVNNYGNVGIGTTNPSDRLSVVGNVLADEICTFQKCFSDFPTTGTIYRHWLNSSNGAYPQVLYVASDYGSDAKNIVNVTTSSSTFTGNNAQVLVGGSIPSNQYGKILFGDGDSLALMATKVTGSGSQLSFGILDNGGSGTETLTINHLGRVGVFNTNPQEEFHVTGKIEATGDICDGTSCLLAPTTTHPSVMYLERTYQNTNSLPQPCPSGWTEVQGTHANSNLRGVRRVVTPGTTPDKWVRTCYRNDGSCEVLKVESSQQSSCPSGWAEAPAASGGFRGDGVLTCYSCLS